MKKRSKNVITEPEHRCRDCALSYGHHNKGADGRWILGKCKLLNYHVLLRHHWCKELKLKPKERDGNEH